MLYFILNWCMFYMAKVWASKPFWVRIFLSIFHSAPFVTARPCRDLGAMINSIICWKLGVARLSFKHTQKSTSRQLMCDLDTSQITFQSPKCQGFFSFTPLRNARLWVDLVKSVWRLTNTSIIQVVTIPENFFIMNSKKTSLSNINGSLKQEKKIQQS